VRGKWVVRPRTRWPQEELELDELAASFVLPEDELDDEESLFDAEDDDSDFDSEDVGSEDDDSLLAPSLPFDLPPDFGERLSVL
jgi:hypothetical protein